MAKLKRIDHKLITPEMFNGTRSYEAALYAIEICNKLIERSKAGDVVFCYENLITVDFEMRFHDDVFVGLYLNDHENMWCRIVGDVREADGKIHCRKYDIREYFKLWRVAKITNVTKVADLTK